MEIVCFNGVGVTYPGGLKALESLSFTLYAGKALALVGSNGSGKSTALRVAAGLLTPTFGSYSVSRGAVVSYAPERFPQNLRFTAVEYLIHMGTISGMTPDSAMRRAHELLDTLGLGEGRDSRISSFSKGMRQKLCLAQALMPEPRLAILDEPMSGLDADTRGIAEGLLNRLKARGTAVLFSTHEAVSGVADDYMKLDAGKVVSFDSGLPPLARGMVGIIAILPSPEPDAEDFFGNLEGVVEYTLDEEGLPDGCGRVRVHLRMEPGYRESALMTLLQSGAHIISVRGPEL